MHVLADSRQVDMYIYRQAGRGRATELGIVGLVEAPQLLWGAGFLDRAISVWARRSAWRQVVDGQWCSANDADVCAGQYSHDGETQPAEASRLPGDYRLDVHAHPMAAASQSSLGVKALRKSCRNDAGTPDDEKRRRGRQEDSCYRSPVVTGLPQPQ